MGSPNIAPVTAEVYGQTMSAPQGADFSLERSEGGCPS
jgi:hypothetical protein